MLKNKILYIVIGLVFGIIISGSIVYAINVASSSVSYSRTGSSVATVEDALDELYDAASFIIYPPGTKNEFIVGIGTSKALCINRNNKINCFGANNYDIEKQHIREVFSDISCVTSGQDIYCKATDYHCSVRANGSTYCTDYIDKVDCGVESTGVTYCIKQ